MTKSSSLINQLCKETFTKVCGLRDLKPASFAFNLTMNQVTYQFILKRKSIKKLVVLVLKDGTLYFTGNFFLVFY